MNVLVGETVHTLGTGHGPQHAGGSVRCECAGERQSDVECLQRMRAPRKEFVAALTELNNRVFNEYILFGGHFKFTAEWQKSMEISHVPPVRPHAQSPAPTIYIPHQKGTFLRIH